MDLYYDIIDSVYNIVNRFRDRSRPYRQRRKFSTKWYNHLGHLHRLDGPAYIDMNYDNMVWREEWYLDGELHRNGGPAKYQRPKFGDFILEYYDHGVLHRIDGPARITKAYHQERKRRRAPFDPPKSEWWINGNRVQELEKKYPLPISVKLTPEEIVEIKLKYG